MSTPVVMPQMGESIAEGTIVRWIKKVGDAVDRDEPLFEISTDKVDAEIPAPAAGVLTEIKVKEGETVAVNSVVATIGAASEVLRRQPRARSRSRRSRRRRSRPLASTQSCRPTSSMRHRRKPAAASPASPMAVRRVQQAGRGRRRASSVVAARPPHRARPRRRHLTDSRLRSRRPRHEARHPGLHRNREPGTGTRDSGRSGFGFARTREPPGVPDARSPGSRVEIKPLSVMRKKIAEHMVMSRRTSAHVHSVFHVNFSTVERIRQQKKAEYEQLGREADLHGVHRQGRGRRRCAASRSSMPRSTATTSSTRRTSTSASPSRSRAA